MADHITLQGAGRPVPAVLDTPDTPTALLVACHYQGGSKEIWLTDEYGDALATSRRNGWAFLAMDAHGHGDWPIDGLDPVGDIPDEKWDAFVDETGTSFVDVIGSFRSERGLAEAPIHLVAVSLGCFTAMDLVRRGLEPVSMTLGAPMPERAYDDESSFHNNLGAFAGCDLAVLTGKDDDGPDEGEVQWWFDQIPSETKTITVMDSGHTLPPGWLAEPLSRLAP